MEEKVNYVNYILFYGRKIACLYDNYIHILSVFSCVICIFLQFYKRTRYDNYNYFFFILHIVQWILC